MTDYLGAGGPARKRFDDGKDDRRYNANKYGANDGSCHAIQGPTRAMHTRLLPASLVSPCPRFTAPGPTRNAPMHRPRPCIVSTLEKALYDTLSNNMRLP
jgi:hypothetical protein